MKNIWQLWSRGKMGFIFNNSTMDYDPHGPISTSLSQITQQTALKNTFNFSPESIKLLKH